MPDKIPSPYNFVPLADKVFFPDWAEQISQDVPFSDGISGEIEVEIEAKTPIYVRNGGAWTKESRNNPEYQSPFKTPDGKYAIPGTSVKGMIRSIVEIASFGKMQRVADHRYGFRDLHNPEYTSQMTKQENNGYAPKVRAGWLSSNHDEWEIVPCDFARVEQEDLERYIGNNSQCFGNDIPAPQKYNFLPNTKIKFDCGQVLAHRHTCKQPLIYRKATNIGHGSTEGIIVLTGQPSKRKPTGCTRFNKRTKRNEACSRGKHMEFVFFAEQENKKKQIPEKVRKEFIFIHSDDKGNPNEEWKFWKGKMDNHKKVPVFYLEANGVIESMGLAMMYRLPYKYGIHDVLKHTSTDHLSEKMDMADLIFGAINDKSSATALRGRVQFGHFIAEGNPLPMNLVTTVLGSPKPTFYPNYIEQDISNKTTGQIAGDFKTYNHKEAKLAGWKRYPTRNDDFVPNPPRAPTHDVETQFSPLPSGSRFKGKIRFHNLIGNELGAIIWALTFGKNDRLRHKLGMAKPYGFGSVDIRLIAGRTINAEGTAVDLSSCLDSFVEMMGKKVPNWSDTDQIRHLLAMADSQKALSHDFAYPVLNPDTRTNHFADFKGANYNLKLALIPYAEKTIRTEKNTGLETGIFTDKSNTPKLELDPAAKFLEKWRKTPNSSAKNLKKDLKDINALTQKEFEDIGRLLSGRQDYKNNLAQATRDYKQEYEKLKNKITK